MDTITEQKPNVPYHAVPYRPITLLNIVFSILFLDFGFLAFGMCALALNTPGGFAAAFGTGDWILTAVFILIAVASLAAIIIRNLKAGTVGKCVLYTILQLIVGIIPAIVLLGSYFYFFA